MDITRRIISGCVSILICSLLLSNHAKRGENLFNVFENCQLFLFQIIEDDVNFQFEPCEDKPGPCSFPQSVMRINPNKHKLLFGQPYRIGLELEVPDSYNNQVNNTKLL